MVPTRGQLMLVVAALVIAIGLIELNYRYPKLTGFGADSSIKTERDANGKTIKTIEEEQSGKTIWDWLSVLGVPLSLAALGYWFQRLQQKQTDDASKEEALQAYFDRLSTLIIDKNLIAVATKVWEADKKLQEVEKQKTTPEDVETEQQSLPYQALSIQDEEFLQEHQELVNASVDVIRARTLSILRRLDDDTKRKEDVIRFLIDTEIISKLKLNLSGIDLAGVNLSNANLQGVNLNYANLEGANLSFAILKKVSLSNTNLSYTNLEYATLDGAYLTFANLSFANLRKATLIGTTLRFTNTWFSHFGGANLRNADISLSKGWSDGRLSKAHLCKTQLPESSKLNSNRDCEKFYVTLTSQSPP
jgi:uncharacterized protein YjbI with pentapeptide repeats